MWSVSVFLGAVMAAAMLLTIDLHLPGGLIDGSAGHDLARPAGFTVLVLAQLSSALNGRSSSRSGFRRLLANRWLWGAIALSLILQVAVVRLPVLNRAFGTRPLSGTQWLVCAAMASAVLWASEVRKAVARLVNSRHHPLPN
jgi:Ca2+-transporting ATPase